MRSNARHPWSKFPVKSTHCDWGSVQDSFLNLAGRKLSTTMWPSYAFVSRAKSSSCLTHFDFTEAGDSTSEPVAPRERLPNLIVPLLRADDVALAVPVMQLVVIENPGEASDETPALG